jgi:hypothetical protein
LMTKQLSSLPTSFVRISITHEETVETIIYGREKIGFVKGEISQIRRRIEL